MATILITGAAGSIGRKLSAHFAARGDTLRRLDRIAHDDVHVCDLSRWGDEWAALFDGVDVVLHLAGDPRPTASWSSVQALNVGMTAHVLEAARRARVPRLVLASTNWVVAGYRFKAGPLHPDDEPWPVNAYGAAKLACESLARVASERDGLSAIVFRIGFCQHEPGNLPGPETAMGRWGQEMWLSDGDLCRGFAAAVDAADSVRFTIVNLMSANVGSRWDMAPTFTQLGFRPQDGCVPVSDSADARRQATAARVREMIEAGERLLAEAGW